MNDKKARPLLPAVSDHVEDRMYKPPVTRPKRPTCLTRLYLTAFKKTNNTGDKS